LTDIGTEMDENEKIHLGFTFRYVPTVLVPCLISCHLNPLSSNSTSFPVEQTALNKGKLLTWTKGFACKNAIGHDVVKLLQDALDRKHVHVRCSALVNDTVGTLLSRSYQSGPALIGAIFGTGTNGAYIDRVETITKLGETAIAESKKGGKDAGEYMVVNTEWGAIDNQVSRYSVRTHDRCMTDTCRSILAKSSPRLDV
jgi:hexokinase